MFTIYYFCWNRNNRHIYIILDENIYNNLTEDKVSNVLNDITDEYFLSVKDKLKYFLEK